MLSLNKALTTPAVMRNKMRSQTPSVSARGLAILIAEKARREAERDLHVFLEFFAWPILFPATPFIDNWHIHAICEHLMAVHRGEISNLIINLPFRMLKSTIVSQAFPAWEWIARPGLQYFTAAYAKDVATRDAVNSRRIIESERYQEAWFDRFVMTSDQNVKTRFENDHQGSRSVTSTEAAGTGFGGNRLIVDDPISALEADSLSAILRSIEWWRGSASTRLNDPKVDAKILVHQRLNNRDLTGYILAEEGGNEWEHLVLPMRYDSETTKTTILFRDPRTIDGELMFPERLPEETVRGMEIALGAYHTAAQLQQNPSNREGSIFKKSDWRYFFTHPEQLASEMDEIIWSWDCTFKDLSTSDFVVGHCWGRKGANKYLLSRVCERMSFTATKRMVQSERERVCFLPKTIAILIEGAANGPAVIDSLKEVVPGLISVTPQGGKVARAFAMQPEQEAGNVWLPSPTIPGFEWVDQAINGQKSYIDLMSNFPMPPDDDVDAMTQGINWYRTREGYVPPAVAPVVGGYREF